MAQRQSRLTKASAARKPREEVKPEFEPVEESNIGENAAPDDSSHLMPSPQASGQTFVTDDPQEQEPNEDPEVGKLQGYPNPEQTPESGMASTRSDDRTGVEVQAELVSTAHKVLDEKLDSIKADDEARAAAVPEEGEEVDYALLPNAPKGDDVIILGPDEPLRVSGNERGNTIVLDKHVYRAKKPFRSLRYTFVLVHNKGAEIPVSRVRTIPKPAAKEPTGTEETKDPKGGDKPPLEKLADAND